MAVVTNVGTLIEPMSRAQFHSNAVKSPLQLFSHTDQLSHFKADAPTGRLYRMGRKNTDQLAARDNPTGYFDDYFD